MKHAFRAMKPDGPAGKGGSVVNISSVAIVATRGKPWVAETYRTTDVKFVRQCVPRQAGFRARPLAIFCMAAETISN